MDAVVFTLMFIAGYMISKHGSALRWWASWSWHKAKGDHRRHARNHVE